MRDNSSVLLSMWCWSHVTAIVIGLSKFPQMPPNSRTPWPFGKADSRRIRGLLPAGASVIRYLSSLAFGARAAVGCREGVWEVVEMMGEGRVGDEEVGGGGGARGGRRGRGRV